MSDCKYKRAIKTRPAAAYAIVDDVSEKELGALKEWLQKMNRDKNIRAEFLLAHAEDGVIWGKFDEDGNLKTSFEASKDPKYKDRIKGWGRAELRQETLWQARIFGDHAELFLWRDGDGLFHARALYDDGAPASDIEPFAKFQDAFDEPQILWGTDAQELGDGFTLMTDGAQGMRHAVPRGVASVEDESKRPLRLVARHYLADEDFARVAASRLVNLQI